MNCNKVMISKCNTALFATVYKLTAMLVALATDTYNLQLLYVQQCLVENTDTEYFCIVFSHCM